MAFYVAVHLVSAVLAQDQVFVSDHSGREAAIAAHPFLKQLKRDYLSLKTASEHALYWPTPGKQSHFLPDKAAEIIRKRLMPVRDMICDRLGIPRSDIAWQGTLGTAIAAIAKVP